MLATPIEASALIGPQRYSGSRALRCRSANARGERGDAMSVA
jgi:hypothetical protein